MKNVICAAVQKAKQTVILRFYHIKKKPVQSGSKVRILNRQLNYLSKQKQKTEMKTIIVKKYGNVTLYQFRYLGVWANAETERITDNKGALLRSETNFGVFECYSLKELKQFILNNISK